MDCEILRTLYVKANGEIVCNDDAGEKVGLGHVPLDGKPLDATALFSGPTFQELRSELNAGRAPWGAICRRCALFRPDEPLTGDVLQTGYIERIQVEASLACGLACPFCDSDLQMKRRVPPYHFPPEAMRGMLEGLTASGVRVGWVEYCGRGEPLTNPRLPEVIGACRKASPSTKQRIITNGNHRYALRVGADPVDEMIVSIDGARQADYEAFRVHGKLDRALKFLEDAVAAKPPGGSVVWKYILFESSDDEAQLERAQDIAHAIGVDTLLFCYSHTPNKSKRLTVENIEAVPIKYPIVRVDAHPSYYKVLRRHAPTKPPVRVRGEPQFHVHVDSVIVYANQSVAIEGWALAPSGVERLTISTAEGDSKSARLGASRPDVRLALPEYDEGHAGFRLMTRMSGLLEAENSILHFDLLSHDAASASFELRLAQAS